MPTLGVNIAIIPDDKILLTERTDFEVWCLPGGEVEPGESLAQAALRETREETGLEVELTRLVGVYLPACLAERRHARGPVYCPDRWGFPGNPGKRSPAGGLLPPGGASRGAGLRPPPAHPGCDGAGPAEALPGCRQPNGLSRPASPARSCTTSRLVPDSPNASSTNSSSAGPFRTGRNAEAGG